MLGSIGELVTEDRPQPVLWLTIHRKRGIESHCTDGYWRTQELDPKQYIYMPPSFFFFHALYSLLFNYCVLISGLWSRLCISHSIDTPFHLPTYSSLWVRFTPRPSCPTDNTWHARGIGPCPPNPKAKLPKTKCYLDDKNFAMVPSFFFRNCEDVLRLLQ